MTTTYTWKEGRHPIFRTTDFEKDNFQIHVSIQWDQDHNWGFGRGHFTDAQEEGAIENPEWEPSFTYQWFVPDMTVDERVKSIMETEKVSEELARDRALRDIGEDMDIVRDPDKAGLTAVFVAVTASYMGVIMGRSSLGGIEISGLIEGDEYVSTMVEEEVTQAIFLASRKLAAIRASGEKTDAK